jgi:predicted DNA-binding mobile mystery protein A
MEDKMQVKDVSLNRINRMSSPAHHLGEGWIREVRTALGMTLNKLGKICGLAPSTLAQAEQRELEGKITVETLRKTAEAMNCELVYQFVPKSDLHAFIEEAAYKKAKRILSSADLHMSLEDQRVHGDLERRILRLKDKLIAEGKVW